MSFSDITSGLWPNKGAKKKTKAEQQADKLAKLARKREQQYAQIHDEVVDTIELRNQKQGEVVQQAVNLASQPAVQQVALSVAGQPVSSETAKRMQRNMTLAAQQVAQNPQHINPAMLTALQNVNISPALAQGVLTGFTDGKAAVAQLSPAQYVKPAVCAYVQTGQNVLAVSPDVAKLAYRQHQLGQQAVRFGKEKDKLQDVRLAQLAAQNGTLNQQKKGRIQSGSLQANSPEELVALLSGTAPVSHITKADIQLSIPGVPGLLPGSAPQKLQLPQVQTEKNQSLFTGKKADESSLTPNELTIQKLKQRDQRIEQLDQQLRQQDPVALQAALQQRDAAQVQVVKQVGQALISQPREAVTMAAGYLWPKMPKSADAQAPFTEAQIQQAEGKVGYALGRQMANGQVETALQTQVRLENLHAAGRPVAQELKNLHQDRVMEIDRRMEIHDGEQFYDAFSAPEELAGAERFYEQAAVRALPRPEDALYLNSQIPRFLPNTFHEGFRRAFNGTQPQALS